MESSIQSRWQSNYNYNKDATSSNSVEEIQILPQGGTNWEKVTEQNNPSQVVISITLAGQISIPTEGKVLWTSKAWSNGNPREWNKHGGRTYDSVLQLRAGHNRNLRIDGKGTAFLSGDQARIYIDVRS